MTVRAAAARALDRTPASRAPATQFLEEEADGLEPRDRRLLFELLLGTLRWLRRLDHVIQTAASRHFDQIDQPLWSPLRIAAYQLLLLDRIPAHAAVSEAVDEASRRTHRGGAGFVNAVLRRVAERPQLDSWPVEEPDPTRRLAIETSHPDFLVSRWLERFGKERTQELLATNNRQKPTQLLAFGDRGGPEALAKELAADGVATEPSVLSPLGLVVREGNPLETEAFRRGDVYLQDQASQAAALLPPPTAGERILDAAAAPGGKSFTLQAWEPAVQVVAADLSVGRLGTLVENRHRLGRGLPLVGADALSPPFASAFDRVLLDLPCTGTGTLRKHPELKWRVSQEELDRLSSQALEMLTGVAPRARRGGLLVAITCSLEQEENEGVIERFLDQQPEFEASALDSRLPPPLAEHIAGPGLWRVLPAGDHDGFTVHVLQRRVK